MIKLLPYSPSEGIEWKQTKQEIDANIASKQYREKHGEFADYKDDLEATNIRKRWHKAWHSRFEYIFQSMKWESQEAAIKDSLIKLKDPYILGYITNIHGQQYLHYARKNTLFRGIKRFLKKSKTKDDGR